MVIQTVFLGNPAILNPATRAASATYWAPPKAKSFTAVQVVAPYCKLDVDLAYFGEVHERYEVTYYSDRSGSPLTGKPGSY
jgi:hypothetical protein